MPADHILSFGSYRLDLAGARLWRGKHAVKLTGKAFAVLRHLVTHAGELVTKDELLQAVWPETVVSDAALTSCIKELRQALRDQAQERRYIETVHRRGFRFIGQLSHRQDRITTPPETVHQWRANEGREVARKLVAILHADVQGYSRLIGQDDTGTLQVLTPYLAMMRECVRLHGGQAVGSRGDSLLATFPSTVAALQSAIAMQQELKTRNVTLSPERRVEFRIGLNAGEILVEGEEIHGDAVNIAVRLEGLAEAGGICLSDIVYRQVKNRVAVGYEDLGEQTLKNITEPVRVYRVRWEPEGQAVSSPATTQPIVSRQLSVVSQQQPATPPQLATGNWPLTTPLVGRELELAQLHTCFAKALNGERQIIFVAGEPGIGKTTLVEAFLMGIRGWGLGVGSASLPTTILTPPVSALTPIPNPQPPIPSPWLGRGQCIEHYGAGEAYLPILEALGRLGREPDGHRLVEILSQHAPTWLVQMPALLGVTELETLHRKTQGATRERMLRELAEAVEALTADRLLILWLEDLHWADVSTLDWLAYVARRREPARLLVIGTYRPVDVLVQGHPLRAVKQELQTRGYCAELLLDFLTEGGVAEYLAQRFVSPSPASAGEGRGEGRSQASFRKLAHLIHRRTDGNPLFMINVVNDLVARGVLVHSEGRWELKGGIEEGIGGVPENLQQLIAQQIERLRPETQRLLEVASVAGAEFSAAAVAVGLETQIDEVEEQCEGLVRREHFLRASGTGEWPDGTVAARYGFLHALYQEVLYHRLTARRRQRLHQQIGEREEKGYGEQAREIAAELALHFERGRDYRKAVQYLQHAGENAVRRSANQEAIALLTKGLELLKTLPDTPKRAQQEITLQLALGTPLIATKGYAAPEVGNTYARAQELCQQMGETPQLFRGLGGLYAFHFSRAEFQTAHALGEQRLILAQSGQDSALLEVAHNSLGFVLFRLGELVPAREHLEQSVVLYNSRKHHLQAFLYTTDIHLGIGCLSHTAWVLWCLGYPDQALKRSREAVALAQELSHPHSLVYALGTAAGLHLHRREEQAVKEQAEAVIELSTEHGFPYWLAWGTILRGWARAMQGQKEEGIAQIRRGLAAFRATGAKAYRPSNLALLAEAYGKGGQAEEGLTLLAEALDLVQKTGERVWEAELYRLYGELSLRIGEPETGRTGDKNPLPDSPIPRFSVSSPEASFLKAIDIARKQQAKSLELRATVSLARLWQRQGKKKEARKMLAETYGWFTEGFDTADLKEAKVLLDELLL